jgi:hypothetical protein
VTMLAEAEPNRAERHALRALWLVVEAVLQLLRYDLTMALFGFKIVHRALSRWPASGADSDRNTERPICTAIDRASSLYWKRVYCLQRSVVTTRMLRRHGIRAELVIGCQHVPFVGHAWTEVNGRTVNDSRVFSERLCVLDRV